MAPQVQTLAQVMAELSPAYAPQEAVVQQRQAGLGAKYDAQRSALTAEKAQGFNAINNQATGRGASFSGIPVDEQATYLSTKYLPGVQQANYQQNEEDLALQGQLAQFATQKYGQAFDVVGKQKSDLNSWNQMLQQQQFEAQQAEQERAFTASQNAATRAASAASDAGPTVEQYLQSAFADNYVGDNTKNGWTESVLAGNLASAYGIARKDALNLAYKYRKQYYGN